MGKRIISQARGHGSSTYRVRKKAFKHKLQFPRNLEGEGTVIKLINSSGHSCPIAKINSNRGSFHVPAFNLMFEGQKISFDKDSFDNGSIIKLSNLPINTQVYCIESRPGDGGKFIKAGGIYATINRAVNKEVIITMPSKKEKKLNGNCRAIVGIIAGAGRTEKPILKAGKQYFIKKAKSKLYPRTSAVKMNVIDHPFGSGRAKNPKSKIAKRNAPPGKRVGLIRPRRTGKKK